MMKPPVLRDERYTTVENASFKIGYLILAFGTLLLVSYRGFAYQETNWDFFALVILSSFAATFYQYKHKIVSFSWKMAAYGVGIAVLAAVIAYLAVTLLK